MKRRLYTWALLGAFSAVVSSPYAFAESSKQGQTPIASSQTTRKVMRMLEAELQNTVDEVKRVEGQGRSIRVRVAYDELAGILTIDLGRNGVPHINGSEWEDQADLLSNAAREILGDTYRVREVRFRFDGQSLDVLRPDNVVTPPRKARASSATNPLVVVDAGHGVYKHYGFTDWRPQRDPYNGIIEDHLTPDLARLLNTYLVARSGATVVKTRSDGAQLHTEANVEHWMMAARYNLQEQYPDNRAIWNSLPNATHSLRERDEDIRSRPLYANFLGAEYLIHLHTDGSDNPAVTGTRVLVQPERPTDLKLGQSILCSMKEVIRADPAFANWTVAAAPAQGDKGENRLAKMPSVIVETGFHTNPNDAVVLQNGEFQKRAMKGIEKGLRMFRKGIDCVDFAITSSPPVSGPHSTNIPITVKYTGAPAYPMYLRTKIVSCPANYSCSQKSTQYAFPETTLGTLTASVRCTAIRRKPGSVIVVDRHLEDADGVKSPLFRSSITCK